MDPTTYLDHLRADAARLSAAARAAGLDAPVPSCPDWTVRDLVGHTGAVYAHKVANMRTGAAAEFEHVRPEGDALGWFDERLDELVGELTSREPDAPTYTWYPHDRTVGFWYRRMAQETAVHRVDAELAAGTPTPVDAALALDGIDEVLVSFLGGPWWVEEPVPDATGRTYAVRAGDDVWRVTLEPTAVTVARGPGDAAATVTGTPHDVLMWLWGRPAAGVVVDGDVEELRSRLALTTD